MTEKEKRERSIQCRYCAYCHGRSPYYCSKSEKANVDNYERKVSLNDKCSYFEPREKAQQMDKYHRLEESGKSFESALAYLAWSSSQDGTSPLRTRKDGSYILELSTVPDLKQKLVAIDKREEQAKQDELWRRKRPKVYAGITIAVCILVCFFVIFSKWQDNFQVEIYMPLEDAAYISVESGLIFDHKENHSIPGGSRVALVMNPFKRQYYLHIPQVNSAGFTQTIDARQLRNVKKIATITYKEFKTTQWWVPK